MSLWAEVIAAYLGRFGIAVIDEGTIRNFDVPGRPAEGRYRSPTRIATLHKPNLPPSPPNSHDRRLHERQKTDPVYEG